MKEKWPKDRSFSHFIMNFILFTPNQPHHHPR